MALLLHPVLALGTVVVVTLALFANASKEEFVYTAESVVAVGRIDVPANAVPGYTQANNTLAGTYSRFVGSDLHVQQMAALADTTTDEILIRGEISGSNVEQSAIIRARVISASESTAIELADLSAVALIDLINSVNDPAADGQALFREHAEAVTSLAESQALVEELQRDLAFFLDAGNNVFASPVQADLRVARADFEQQQLRVNTLAALYTESQRARSDSDLARVLNAARSSGSNRSARLQLGIALGLLLGIALGTGLAWLATNARSLVLMRRSFRSNTFMGEAANETDAEVLAIDEADFEESWAGHEPSSL